MFNEKPSHEERLAVTEEEKVFYHVLSWHHNWIIPIKIFTQGGPRFFESAVLHTTVGDITIKLFVQECPRTIENFCVHAKNSYYNGHIFHRVIKQVGVLFTIICISPCFNPIISFFSSSWYKPEIQQVQVLGVNPFGVASSKTNSIQSSDMTDHIRWAWPMLDQIPTEVRYKNSLNRQTNSYKITCHLVFYSSSSLCFQHPGWTTSTLCSAGWWKAWRWPKQFPMPKRTLKRTSLTTTSLFYRLHWETQWSFKLGIKRLTKLSFVLDWSLTNGILNNSCKLSKC